MAIRVGMVSLGCPKNQVDAEIMLGLIEDGGFEIVNDAGVSDVVIINTCGFIESAKEESIENILEFCTLKEEGRIKCVVITGCLAERYKDEVAKEIPEADVILGIGSNSQIVSAIKEALAGQKIREFAEKNKLPFNGRRILANLSFYAYVKIAEGCDNCCSYCAIPMIRGRYRSRASKDIIDEVKNLVDDGVTEIILVAQDTTRYGEDLDGDESIVSLLKELCRIDGLHWIRILYSYPERITDEFLDVMASEPKIVKYLDMPIQHVNSDILAAMNRQSDEESLRALIEKIRTKMPDITLRSTLIAGFPGETQEQFEQLSEFVKEMRFDRMGCFAYSQEENTKAAKMPNQLDEDTKRHRAEIINEQQTYIMISKNEELVGREVEVVVEGFDRYAECYFGRSAADAPDIDPKIFFTSEVKPTIGEYIKVKIEQAIDCDLIGVHINEYSE